VGCLSAPRVFFFNRGKNLSPISTEIDISSLLPEIFATHACLFPSFDTTDTALRLDW